MDSFCGEIGEFDACKTCPYLGERCNYNDLRLAIEDMLGPKYLARLSSASFRSVKDKVLPNSHLTLTP